MLKLSPLFLFLTVLAVAADNPETFTERSQSRAREIVDAAVVAIGGAEALQSIETVKLQLEGETWPRFQMPTPEPPFTSGTFRESLLFDLRNNRLHLEQRVTGAGFEGHTTVILKDGEGTTYDNRARTATPIPAAQATGQQFVQYYRRLPNLLLRQALDRATSLRYLGDEVFNGQKHDVITFVMPDTQQVALYVDSKTRLISKYELIFTDPVAGEDASEILFSDYVSAGNLKVPRQWGWRIAGQKQADYKLMVQFNPPVTDAAFAFADTDFRKVAPAPTPTARVEKLAEGVYVMLNAAGPNQNTLAVEFEDFILAVEAPGTSAGAENVIRRIRETIPGKEIRYIAMTHHHGDHIGGLRGFIAEGATVVTTAANRGIVEAMARAPQKDRLATAPRKVEFALLESGKRRFSDGRQTVELLDIGPNPHAREMVVAWLPEHRILFQGDLFFLPEGDAPAGPPQASTLAFARALEERGLAPDRIASVHGRTATRAEFLESVR